MVIDFQLCYPVVEEFANGDSKEPMIPALSELSLEAKPKPCISAGEGSIAGVTEARKSLSTFSHVNGQLQSYMYEVPGTQDGLSSSLYPRYKHAVCAFIDTLC